MGEILRIANMNQNISCNTSADIPNEFYHIIFCTVAKILNLEIINVQATEKTHGTCRIENSTTICTGLSGMLFRNEADIASDVFSYQEARARNILYSNPVLDLNFVFAVGPRLWEKAQEADLKLGLSRWAYLLVGIIILFLSIIKYFKESFCTISFVDQFWNQFSEFFWQKNSNFRPAIVGGALLVYIFNANFQCQTFMASKIHFPFQNAKEFHKLLLEKKYQLIFRRPSHQKAFFAGTYFENTLENVNPPLLVQNSTKLFDLLCNSSRYVLFDNELAILAPKNPCQLHVVIDKEFFQNTFLYFCGSKGSEALFQSVTMVLKALFRLETVRKKIYPILFPNFVRRMTETGIDLSANYPKPLHLHSIYSLFWFLITGNLLALLLLVLENVYSNGR